MTIATLADETSQRLIDDQIEPFIKHLRAVGYAERTLRKKKTVVRAFARWMKGKQIATDELSATHVAGFVARLPRKRKPHIQHELAVMRLFCEYLRPGSMQPVQKASAANGLLQQYEDYLRHNRGLAENSIHVYVPFIHEFLRSQSKPTGCVSADSFDTLMIRSFLIRQTLHRSGEYARLLATALRSFLGFLFLSGQTLRDLSSSVPTVRKYRHAVPPAFLSTEEVERVLTATVGSTPIGRRDYAILLLLARLGLRAGEVASLELEDIRWRVGEIVVRGKGGTVDQLPLLSDIGEALAIYLRQDRGLSSSRRVFLRMWAPRIGLAGPAAIGHIVRLALARAAVHRSGRGAAHLFRHGLATKMIRQGAAMSDISEVLRHHSQITTAHYAQISFEALRGVARPWPTSGGDR
jgi:integrase/recombinase XerD